MSQQSLFPLTLQEILEREEKLKIEKSLVLSNAFQSSDVEEIYRAQSYLRSIEEKKSNNHKSLLLDPLELTSSFGYKDKPYSMSYDLLRGMAKTHIIKAIIETRKDQVTSFCEPQVSNKRYTKGFTIQKRTRYIESSQDKKLTKAEEKRIEFLVEFLLYCGVESTSWHADTFDIFLGKIIDDSLTYDQACFEIVRNKKGEPVEFFANDGSTYRIADSFLEKEEEAKNPQEFINGYGPSYVQLYQQRVWTQFYPWELCFGIRNPKTDIRMNGYGRSELEDMIQVVTSVLNADSYNSNFFRVGSAPKGILKFSGNVNQNTLDDFRTQWISQVAGVANSHKIPLINADKIDFINTHIPNKDMEFSKYHEFLIKITCALYKIDPSEVGFNMSGTSNGQNGLGGDATQEKLTFSRDKGLKPLLKKIQFWINKYIIWPLDKEYEFRFVGIEGEDEQTDLDRDVTMLTNFMTLNEIRAKRNLEPLEGGDLPLNPVYLQAQAMSQQNQQQQMGIEGEGDQEQEDPFGEDNGTDEQEDPFLKSLNEEIGILLSQPS